MHPSIFLALLACVFALIVQLFCVDVLPVASSPMHLPLLCLLQNCYYRTCSISTCGAFRNGLLPQACFTKVDGCVVGELTGWGTWLMWHND